MFKNYIITAFRTFWRNKSFTAINILGLAVGISASLVIYLMVHYEFSFDEFEKDSDRIYRVVNQMHFPDEVFKNSGVASPFPAAVREGITGIEESSHFILWTGVDVAIPTVNSVPKVYRKQPNLIFADDHYFNLFHYEWIAGSAQSFKEQNTVVLTESRAKSYFSYNTASDVIGQRITYDDSTVATIVGVVKDLDEITDFTFREFISLATVAGSNLKNYYGWDEWGSITSSTQFFVKLSEGTSPLQVENQFSAMVKKYTDSDKSDIDYLLQPLSELHFNPDYDNFNQRQGNKQVLYGLMVVAAFLLLLGCINFINLNTAQASQRTKEIGIRKTMGGSRKQLVIQFLSETFVLAFLSTLVSLFITPWLLKVFSDFIPPEISFGMVTESHVLVFLTSLIAVVTLLAGFYPALVLSGYKPVTVLKNQVSASDHKSRKLWLRKSLTVTQFVGAQFFIIATILVSKQIHYSLNKDLGFRKDAIIWFGAPYSDDPSKRKVLLDKLRAIPEIDQACLGGPPPASSGTMQTTMEFDNNGKKTENTVEMKYGDESFFNLYGMKLIAGRYLQPSDTLKEYLINEHYARALGFQNPEDVIGKTLSHNKAVPVVGVLKDFNSKSTKTAIDLLAFTASSDNYNCYHVLLRPQNTDATAWQNAIKKMESAYKGIYPERDFNYHFFDESIAAFYKDDQNISKLLSWATGLAILISCLGLLGLAIYTTNQRTKEIGVRKVLGATIEQIVLLLSKDFMQLIVLAFVIAVPLAWWATHKWLENFAYRTTIDWWVFAAGGSAILIIALTILSLRTVKAATANPVKSLRTE